MYNFNLESFPTQVSSMLSDLFLSRTSADLTLLCQDQVQIQTHKFLLSASSSVFRSVLLNNCPVIYLRGVESQDMESLLEFLYLGRTSVTVDRVEQVLGVARDLELLSLGDTGSEDSQLNPVTDDKFGDKIGDSGDGGEEREDLKPSEEIVTKSREKVKFVVQLVITE